MKMKIAFIVLVITSMVACSCNNSDEINCGQQSTTVLGEESTFENSANTSENSSESSYGVSSESSTINARDCFIEKYGYDIDIFDYLLDDELYTLLLNNSIDRWASDAGPAAGTTGEMLEIENILHQNWSREIDVSLGNLEGILSADIYNALCVNVQHKIELASETRMLSQNILRDLELDGTYSPVLTKVQLNEAYEKIVFELKYLEYVAYTYYDISDKQVSIQFIES